MGISITSEELMSSFVILSKTGFQTGVTAINAIARPSDITDSPYHTPSQSQWKDSTYRNLQDAMAGILNDRMFIRAIPRVLNVTVSTISHLRRLFEEFGTTANHPHIWRPRVATPAHDCYIQIRHLCDRLRPATTTADENLSIWLTDWHGLDLTPSQLMLDADVIAIYM